MLRVAFLALLATTASAQVYTADPVAASLENIATTGQALRLYDDQSVNVSLGFDFTYYGQTFSDVWVSSNGFLSFSTNNSLCCSAMPMAEAPRNGIYGIWSDLISSNTNPYVQTKTYADGTKTFIAGWYNTREYYNSSYSTFEIMLNQDGSIRMNYGDVNNAYHIVGSGITGPTSSDYIELMYGSDPNSLDYSSYLISSGNNVEETRDCSNTPNLPECIVVSPVVEVASIEVAAEPTAITSAEEVSETVATVAAHAEDVAEVAVEPEASQVVEIAVEAAQEVAATAEVVQSVAVASDPERLTPDQVAALAAEIPQVVMNVDMSSSQTSMTSPTGILSSQSSQNEQQATLQLLAPSSASSTSDAPQQSQSQTQSTATSEPMASGQVEVMSEMAVSVNMTQYAQARIPDRPGFYPPEQIYRRNRIPDANMVMYRLTNTSDTRWNRLVDEQYGQ